MDIKKMINSEVGNQLVSKLGVTSDQTSGIVNTIVDVIKEKGVDKIDDSGSEISSALESKNGLSSDLAGKAKDIVVPIVLNALKKGFASKFGDTAGGLLNKFKL